MLIDLKDKLNDQQIVELLGYSVFPDQDKVKEAIEMYRSNRSTLKGYFLDDEVIGLIGYEWLPKEEIIKIHHISVAHDYRGLGYGRGIILELIEMEKPKKIVAETDEDAVDFYRNIGFEIISLGEKYPFHERFECSFETDFA